MGKPLTIKLEDDKRLLSLKRKLGAKSKVDVLRKALSLLEKDFEKSQRIKRWEKGAKLVSESSYEVLKDFSKFSGMKKIK